MQGHSDVLRALLEEDFSPALDFVPGRDTILHICIIYNRFEALQYLLPTLPRDFVRGSNENGETLLHLAVRYCRPEMIQYLVAKTDISKVATNFMECTAWDGARHIDPPIRNLLVGSDPLVDVLVRNYNVVRWTLLSVAAVIATTASQTIVSPPGGVYQDGRSVLAVIHHSGFESIMGSNFSSLVWTVIAMILILCTVRWNGFLMVLFILYLLLASTICVVVSKLSSIGVLAQENRTILGVLEVFAFETVVMLSGVGIAWVLYKFGYAPAWRRFIRIVWNFICN